MTHLDIVKLLVRRHADIQRPNYNGGTCLINSVQSVELCEFLLQNGADVNRGDNEGWTPLHATASCGFLSIAKFLIDNNANISAVNNDGELAIDISESDERWQWRTNRSSGSRGAERQKQ